MCSFGYRFINRLSVLRSPLIWGKLIPRASSLILENPIHMQEIADQGYAMAKGAHTWAHRAGVLHDLIEK